MNKGFCCHRIDGQAPTHSWDSRSIVWGKSRKGQVAKEYPARACDTRVKVEIDRRIGGKVLPGLACVHNFREKRIRRWIGSRLLDKLPKLTPPECRASLTACQREKE